MTEKKSMTPPPTDVIALPPLRMVLVHAKNETLNHTSTLSDLRDSADFVQQQADEEKVDPDSLKKLIQHLENKKAK